VENMFFRRISVGGSCCKFCNNCGRWQDVPRWLFRNWSRAQPPALCGLDLLRWSDDQAKKVTHQSDRSAPVTERTSRESGRHCRSAFSVPPLRFGFIGREHWGVANAASRFRPEHAITLGNRGIPVGYGWALSTPALPCGLQPGLVRVPPLAGLLARCAESPEKFLLKIFRQGTRAGSVDRWVHRARRTFLFTFSYIPSNILAL